MKLENVSGSSALIKLPAATRVTRDALYAPGVAERSGAGVANTYHGQFAMIHYNTLLLPLIGSPPDVRKP